MVLPLLPLSLVANECRWILATWKDGEARDVLIWSSAGLRVLAVLTCAAVGVSAVQVAWKRRETPEGTCGLVQCGFLAACCLCAPSSLACSLLRAAWFSLNSIYLRFMIVHPVPNQYYSTAGMVFPSWMPEHKTIQHQKSNTHTP